MWWGSWLNKGYLFIDIGGALYGQASSSFMRVMSDGLLGNIARCGSKNDVIETSELVDLEGLPRQRTWQTREPR
jgi:hypothetical protein